MTRPSVGSWADELYDAMRPVAHVDESEGWPLLTFHEAVGLMFQDIRDLVRDTDQYPGWSSILDPNRVPLVAVAWLGQFVGVRVPPRGRIVDRYNLSENPSPAINADGWSVGLGGGTVTRVPDVNNENSEHSFQLVAGDGTQQTLVYSRNDGSRFPIRSNTAYTVAMDIVRHPAAADRDVHIDIQWYRLDGTLIGTQSTGTFKATTDYVRHSVTLQPFEAAVEMRVLLTFSTGDGATAGDTYRWDQILIQEAEGESNTHSPGTSFDETYFDGASPGCFFLGDPYDSISVHTSAESDLDWLIRMRALIKDAPAWKRGTPAAMRDVAKRTLTGAQTLRMLERYDPDDPDGSEGNSAYHLTVETYTAETPDPAATLRALISQKPAGVVLHHVMIAGQTYDQLRDSHVDYDAVQADYPDYDAARRDIPL